MTLLERLDRVMQEPWMKDLIGEAYRPNFWSIIEYGRGSYETRYSRMLRWLMDPSENHGLTRRPCPQDRARFHHRCAEEVSAWRSQRVDARV
jgi:hypothetical protein